LLGELLGPMRYYWVTSQSEYSTDVLFRSRADLEELMPWLLQYSTLYFEARDVMTFLGRKLNGNFQGDLITDQLDFSQLPRRLPGRRVKHRMKRNWIKMYNKDGSALRVETVFNQPDEFRIRRRVRRFFLQLDQRLGTLRALGQPPDLTLLLRDLLVAWIGRRRLRTSFLRRQPLELAALTRSAPVSDVREVQTLPPHQRSELTRLGAPVRLAQDPPLVLCRKAPSLRSRLDLGRRGLLRRRGRDHWPLLYRFHPSRSPRPLQ
jgi:hypothetical protein